MKHAPERYWIKKKMDRIKAQDDMVMHEPDPKALENFRRPAYTSEKVDIEETIDNDTPDDIFICIKTFETNGKTIEKGNIYNYYQSDQIEFIDPKLLLRQGTKKLLLSLDEFKNFQKL